ncbi:MAG: hypothetical protein MUF23_02835 [Pirellula sp.]|nr:hypothetical protein [Pirellula sp.]
MLMRPCTSALVLVLVTASLASWVGAQEAGTSKESAKEGTSRRSLLDEGSQELVEPKRLPGKIASGSNSLPEEASNSQSTNLAPQELRTVEPKKLIETAGPESEEKILLRYRFEPGMVIRSEVTHLAKNGTRIDSVQQEANSRTVTDKSWRVIAADGGTTTFEYWIDRVDMSQQVGDAEEIRYNSDEPTDAIPPQFAGAADTVGKRVSTIRIDETGMVVARSDIHNPPHMGMGDVTLPLPKNPVSVGATWEIPREMKIQRKDGTQRLVKFREFFKLEKISAGVATVSVKSEPLSTMGEPSEEAQILQQLSNGTIRFDIDAGRMIAKELAWDHQVVAFSGPGSVLEYSARLNDEVVAVEETSPAPSRSAKAVGSGVRDAK